MKQPRPDRACVHVISDKDLKLNSKVKVLIGGTHENFEYSINGEIVSKYHRESEDILYIVDIADSNLPDIGVTTAIVPRLVLADAEKEKSGDLDSERNS